MSPRTFSPLIVLLSVATACSARDAAPARYHVDSLPNLAATVEQRFGSRENPDSGFSRIGALDIDRDGNLYVLESRDREIRVFTPDFKRVRTIGRAGSGPGEFQGTPRFGVHGDTVWAISSSSRIPRVTLFNRDGKLLSSASANTVRIGLPRSYGYVMPSAMGPDGRFFSDMSMIASSRDEPPSGVQETDSIPVPRVAFDGSGAVVDTTGWDEKPPPRMWRAPGKYNEGRWEIVRYNDQPYMVPDPPTDMPYWLPLHDGRIDVENPQPTTSAATPLIVTRLSLRRDTIYSTRIFYLPERYSEAELNAIAESESAGGMAMSIESGINAGPPKPDPTVAKLIREKMQFPGFKIPLEGVWLATDESVWLRVMSGAQDSARYIVLDVRGTPEGVLTLSSRAELLWRRGNVLYVAEPDEMDVPWLVRYRLSSRR